MREPRTRGWAGLWYFIFYFWYVLRGMERRKMEGENLQRMDIMALLKYCAPTHNMHGFILLKAREYIIWAYLNLHLKLQKVLKYWVKHFGYGRRRHGISRYLRPLKEEPIQSSGQAAIGHRYGHQLQDCEQPPSQGLDSAKCLWHVRGGAVAWNPFPIPGPKHLQSLVSVFRATATGFIVFGCFLGVDVDSMCLSTAHLLWNAPNLETSEFHRLAVLGCNDSSELQHFVSHPDGGDALGRVLRKNRRATESHGRIHPAILCSWMCFVLWRFIASWTAGTESW